MPWRSLWLGDDLLVDGPADVPWRVTVSEFTVEHDSRGVLHVRCDTCGDVWWGMLDERSAQAVADKHQCTGPRVVHLEELRHGQDSDYVERWLCEPPAIGVPYQVLDQDWDDDSDPPVRTIRQVRMHTEEAS